MAETTKIEWADATVNPWWGCTKVSPACRGCYAESLAHRWGKDVWGPGKPREDHRVGAAKLARKLERQAVAEGRRLRVFCASMADWLDDEVPAEWLADLLALIAQTPHLDWLLLSKRPHLWRDRLGDAVMFAESRAMGSGLMAYRWIEGEPPENVWVGTTVEDQQRADERIPALLAIPARVRFLSMEPLLGPVDISRFVSSRMWPAERLHWVITGGESGRNARPSHPDWFRDLRDQAQAAGVAFHFKQWGEHNEFGRRIGKAEAGRVLDGRTWDEVPAVARG
jgi:protein gp37